VASNSDWRELLPRTGLKGNSHHLEMDKEHFFTKELADVGVVSHLRLSIYPDGGVSRLRIYGRPDDGPTEEI
jgi:allantoicase